jgi:outer membrane protein assembly factor BamB
MDYRLRWQQRRQQRQRQRILLAPALVLAAVLVALLLRGLSGGNALWVYQGADPLTPHIAAGPETLFVVWASGHVEVLSLQDGKRIGRGLLFSVPERFNAVPLHAQQTLFFGSDLGVMRALDARTGDPLWEVRTGGAIRGRPLLYGGRLYFGSDDGRLYAVQALQGQRFWTQDLGGAIASDVTTVGTQIVAATTTGNVYGLDLDTGRIIWKKALRMPVESPVTAISPLVLVGTDDGTVHLLETRHGKEVARYRTWGLPRTPGAVGEREVCFGSSDGWLRTISRDGRRPLWAYDLGGPVTVGPECFGGIVYAAQTRRLVALDMATGRVLRQWRGGPWAGNLLVVGPTVYVGTDRGQVLALPAPEAR